LSCGPCGRYSIGKARTELPGGSNKTTHHLSGLSVCVVACHYRPESAGSAPYNSMLVDTLVAAGADVEVLTGVPHYPQWKVLDERYLRGLRWRERDGAARLTRLRHAVPPRPNLLGRMRQESSFAALSAPLVYTSSADVIVAVTPLVGAMAAAYAGRRGRPLGVIVHDLAGNAAEQSGSAGGRAARTVGAAEYAMLSRADKVGVITPRFQPALTTHGVAPDRITVLPIFTHVNSSEMAPVQARRRLGWDEAGLTVVHTGNMGMKQGLEYAVAAARIAAQMSKDVRFAFVGDGNQRQDLEVRASGLPNVRFVDPVSDQDYPTVLAAADVLLLHERPGVAEMSLPSKLTSYVTARRPILASVDEHGITKALLDSYGAAVMVPSGDPMAMLNALDRLCHDDALVAEVVAGAEDMGTAEFSADHGRVAFREFVASLGSTTRA
jgi:colanic acid biosynthesis glycosyl transferase WcaI